MSKKGAYGAVITYCVPYVYNLREIWIKCVFWGNWGQQRRNLSWRRCPPVAVWHPETSEAPSCSSGWPLDMGPVTIWVRWSNVSASASLTDIDIYPLNIKVSKKRDGDTFSWSSDLVSFSSLFKFLSDFSNLITCGGSHIWQRLKSIAQIRGEGEQ